MKTIVRVISSTLVVSAVAAPLRAQELSPSVLRQTEMRYQIGQMERVLQGAVEHGARVWRDRFSSMLPVDMLLSENVRVRGFRLDGYGVLFDVEVPALESAPLWSFRTLDQNDLGLASALDSLRAFVEKTGDLNVQQALKRVELQVAPSPAAQTLATSSLGAGAVGAPASTPGDARAPSVGADAMLADPQEAYRTAVKDALMEAMLDHSRGLDISPAEWLAIAARRIDDRPPLAPVDSDAVTMIIRMQGSDLTAFLGGQISRDEAKTRMDVRVF